MPAHDAPHFRVLLTFKLGAAPGLTTLRGLQVDLCEWVAKRDPRATVDVWFHDLTGKLRPVAKPEPPIVSWPDTVQTIDD